MSDEKIYDQMIDFILEQEKTLIENKMGKEKKKQRDFVKAVIKKLEEEVKNENQTD